MTFSNVALRYHKAKRRKCLISGNPTDPPVLPQTQFFLSHNLHLVKIGNFCSWAKRCFGSIPSFRCILRQHGKTGAQVNHVIGFFPNVRLGDRYSQKGSDIIAGFITSTKYEDQFCNTIPSISLFKVQKWQILSCLCTQIHSNYGKKQPPFVCKQTRGLSDLGVYQLIILAGIISYIYYFIFTFDFYLIIFSNTKMINDTKLKTEKTDCHSYFGAMQGSVITVINLIIADR